MKKILMVLLAAMVVFGFTACDESTPAPSEITETTVASYFNQFATTHIFNEIIAAFDNEGASDEISGLTATFIAGADKNDDETAIDDTLDKVVFTYNANEQRYNGFANVNGEAEGAANANKVDQRLVSGAITLTVYGNAAGTEFTAQSFALAGDGLSLSDAQEKTAEGKAYEKLPNLTVNINDFAVAFAASKAPTITLEKSGEDYIVKSITGTVSAESLADSSNVSGSVTVLPNNFTCSFATIVELLVAAASK